MDLINSEQDTSNYLLQTFDPRAIFTTLKVHLGLLPLNDMKHAEDNGIRVHCVQSYASAMLYCQTLRELSFHIRNDQLKIPYSCVLNIYGRNYLC